MKLNKNIKLFGGKMDHILFRQKVKEEYKKEYIKRHKEANNGFLKIFKNAGMKQVIVWLDDKSNDLFVYMMAEDFDTAMKKVVKEEIHDKWVSEMQPMLSDIQDYSEEPNIKQCEKIFDVVEQIEKGKSKD